MTAGAQPDDVVTASQQRWRAVRGLLKKRRHEFAAQAAALYQDVPRVEGTDFLCRPGWVPEVPIALDTLQLHWAATPPALAIAGSSPESELVRPLTDAGQRFACYADAVGVLDRPAVFENRLIYRLVGAHLDNRGASRLIFSSGRYFEAISVAEALAHEFAAAAREHGQEVGLDRLPLRAAVGDPCDLSRRPASAAITTLTLRRTRSGEASFLLHWRDPAKVTHAGGLYQVLPVGIFQPADDNPASLNHDLNLWHSMVREYSEELLGEPEDYDHLGSPIQYGAWEFYRKLTEARLAGDVRLWIVGAGVDPLTLVADILAVAVFDAPLFDDVFGNLVAANSEGDVVSDVGTVGFAFTEGSVGRFSTGHEPMQAAGAAVLQLAWEHRRSLLG